MDLSLKFGFNVIEGSELEAASPGMAVSNLLLEGGVFNLLLEDGLSVLVLEG